MFISIRQESIQKPDFKKKSILLKEEGKEPKAEKKQVTFIDEIFEQAQKDGTTFTSDFFI